MIERLEGGIFGVQFQIAVEVVKVDPENIDSAPSSIFANKVDVIVAGEGVEHHIWPIISGSALLSQDMAILLESLFGGWGY